MTRLPLRPPALRCSSARRGMRIGGRQFMRGQQNGNLRALAELAVDPDRALVGENDALAQRQTQTHTGSCGLGGEEWIEHPLEMFARDADAVVDYANDDDWMVAVLAAGFIVGDHAN